MSAALDLLLAAALGLALLAGCDPDGTVAAGPSETAAVPSFHTRYGFPGPWSRENARREDFDADSSACLARSSAARRQATDGNGNGNEPDGNEPDGNEPDGNELAYRSFLECMAERGWTRGLDPASRHASEDEGRAAATPRP